MRRCAAILGVLLIMSGAVLVGDVRTTRAQSSPRVNRGEEPNARRTAWVTLGEAVVTDRPVTITLPAHRVGAYSRIGVLAPASGSVRLQQLVINDTQSMKVGRTLKPGRVTSVQRAGAGQRQVVRTVTLYASSARPVRIKLVGVAQGADHARRTRRTKKRARRGFTGWTLAGALSASGPGTIKLKKACTTRLGFSSSRGVIPSKLTLVGTGAVQHTLHASLRAGALRKLDLRAPYMRVKKVSAVRWAPDGVAPADARVMVYCAN